MGRHYSAPLGAKCGAQAERFRGPQFRVHQFPAGAVHRARAFVCLVALLQRQAGSAKRGAALRRRHRRRRKAASLLLLLLLPLVVRALQQRGIQHLGTLQDLRDLPALALADRPAGGTWGAAGRACAALPRRRRPAAPRGPPPLRCAPALVYPDCVAYVALVALVVCLRGSARRAA